MDVIPGTAAAWLKATARCSACGGLEPAGRETKQSRRGEDSALRLGSGQTPVDGRGAWCAPALGSFPRALSVVACISGDKKWPRGQVLLFFVLSDLTSPLHGLGLFFWDQGKSGHCHLVALAVYGQVPGRTSC